MAGSRRDKGDGSIFPWGDGRWRGYLTLEDGQRKYVTGRTRNEVQKKLREAERSVERGVDLLAERMTVTAWCERWLSAREIEVTTRSKYEACLRLHVCPFIDGAPSAIRAAGGAFGCLACGSQGKGPRVSPTPDAAKDVALGSEVGRRARVSATRQCGTPR